MFKFFRNLRKQLAAENKPTKYLRYAIGEILLVVIGILIALQINNSSELRKSRVYELKMLKEIKKELVQDTIYFSIIRARAQSLKDGAIGLIQLYDVENPEMDSLKKYHDMLMGFQFAYRKGAYEALKSTGLDKVSNDSLRFSITNLYDFIYPRSELLLGNVMMKLADWNTPLQEISNIEVVKDVGGLKNLKFVPRVDMAQNPKAAGVIARYKYVGSQGVGRLNGIINRSSEVLAQLNLELNSND